MWDARDIIQFQQYCEEYKLALLLQVVADNAKDGHTLAEAVRFVADCRERLVGWLIGKEGIKSGDVLAKVELEAKRDVERQQKLARRSNDGDKEVQKMWQ